MRRFTSEPERPRCSLCGTVLRWDSKWGFCDTRSECRAAKEAARRRSDGIPSRLLMIRAGDTFGRLTVLKDYANDGAAIPCRCECGAERLVPVQSLRRGDSRSCGCLRRTRQMRPKPMYISAGDVFSRLTALEDAWSCHDRIRFRCECGTESVKSARLVGKGQTKSCGCLRNRKKHGLSQHWLVPTWYQVAARTGDAQHPAYANYGGRGIGLFAGWQGMPDGFREFAAWIEANLGPRPAGWSLDRIDNDGNYEPGNIRWATAGQQQGNRRSVKSLTEQRDALLELVAGNPLLAARAQEIVSN
jgi:hypothetical protein